MEDFHARLLAGQYAARDLRTEVRVPIRHPLLAEGTVATQLYLVRQGGLRVWHSPAGQDRTLQFYFEGSAVSSLESFLTG